MSVLHLLVIKPTVVVRIQSEVITAHVSMALYWDLTMSAKVGKDSLNFINLISYVHLHFMFIKEIHST